MSGNKKGTANKRGTANKKSTANKKGTVAKKEHGTWLTVCLVFIVLQSLLYSILLLYLRGQQRQSSPAWVWIVVFVLALVDIVAMAAVWKWKKWGLQLFAVSTVVSIVVGLILTASQLVVFHDILPLVILGYLVKDKWSLFS